MLVPLTDHQLLVFWVQLFVLLCTARLLGALARRIGLPSVIGELLAGVLLGPSVLGKIWPDGFDWFLPDDPAQSAALLAIGWIGVVLLLLVTGFETDLGLIGRLGRAAVLVAIGSLVVPFALGVGLGFRLPAAFIGDDVGRGTFVLFVATALSISSLPVIAKILNELDLMRRNFAQITLAAGMANDVIGWVLLGVIAGLASTGAFSGGRLAITLVGMVAFIVLAFTVGQRAVDSLLRRARVRQGREGGSLAVTLLVALCFAVITQALHVEAVLGAFVAGIVLGRSRFQRDEVKDQVESITSAVFAPIFFATAGLRVDLASLTESETAYWAVVVVVVATVGKFAGAYAGARLGQLTRREGLALGAGLNARGALEIVIATIGLSLGVLSEAAYTVVVLMAIVTTILAPPILRAVTRNWTGTAEEQDRLDRELSHARNIVVRPSRMLLPSRGGPGSIAAAQVLHFAWPPESAVTVLSVGVDELTVDPVLNVLHGREVEVHTSPRTADEAPDRIIEESRLGYGVVGVGVADVASEGPLLSSLVDDLINRSPLPVVIVRAARRLETPLPPAFTRAFVPVAGGRSSRAAQEIAFNLSRALGTEVVLSHVVTDRPREASRPASVPPRHGRASDPTPQGVAERLLEQAVELAAEIGVDTRTHVLRSSSSPGEEIVTAARDAEADLVVLGARARRLGGRPYLGANVEHVLHDSDATIVVVILPEDRLD